MNLSFLFRLAVCRTRSSAWDTLSRSCARPVLCWPAFPLAPALRSTVSAADRSAMFVGFIATMPGSDFSRPCVGGVGSSPSRRGPTARCASGRTRDLPVPAQGASAHARVFDHAGPPGRSRSRSRTCRLPRSETRRRPNLNLFRGSMAGLCAPLPTLRPPSHERIRTARGRGGSLRLPRDGLAPSTPCRSPGALRSNRNFYSIRDRHGPSYPPVRDALPLPSQSLRCASREHGVDGGEHNPHTVRRQTLKQRRPRL